jgi:FKBP-type peptidyl-prolyl cis-trans isomerase SlyD
VGEKKKVSVTAADAYGEPNPENYETVPRSIFPDDLELVEGMGLRMVDSETKEPVEAFVAEIGAEEVLLDFNHALAGETLHFAVEVVGLRPASADELDHGHVHGGHAH